MIFFPSLGYFLVSTLPPVTFAERSLDLQNEAASDSAQTESTAIGDWHQQSSVQSYTGEGA